MQLTDLHLQLLQRAVQAVAPIDCNGKIISHIPQWEWVKFFNQLALTPSHRISDNIPQYPSAAFSILTNQQIFVTYKSVQTSGYFFRCTEQQQDAFSESSFVNYLQTATHPLTPILTFNSHQSATNTMAQLFASNEPAALELLHHLHGHTATYDPFEL